jgi:hypothetical protein
MSARELRPVSVATSQTESVRSPAPEPTRETSPLTELPATQSITNLFHGLLRQKTIEPAKVAGARDYLTKENLFDLCRLVVG